jgi:hypothetical protein
MPPPMMSRPTPPMMNENGEGMAVAMPGAQGPEQADPMQEIASCLATLGSMGVQIQPGPNGTIILAGVPAEILGQMGASDPGSPEINGGSPGGGGPALG